MPIKVKPPKLLKTRPATYSIFFNCKCSGTGIIFPTVLNVHFECLRCRSSFQKHVQNKMNVEILASLDENHMDEQTNQAKKTLSELNGENPALFLKCKCSKEMFIEFTEHFTTENVNITTANVTGFLFSCTCGVFYYEQSSNVNFNCFDCNSKISINYENVIIKPVKNKNTQIKASQIEKNKPLPDNGTCSHYKKSFRWFLFPCCGNLYPCDICHEENEEHPLEMAKKILCGFCSNYKCDCESKKGSSAHWNGGKGTRDKTKMSKKDKQKYKR